MTVGGFGDTPRNLDGAENLAAEALSAFLNRREADPAADPAGFAPSEPSAARAFWHAVAAVGALQGPVLAGKTGNASDDSSADAASTNSGAPQKPLPGLPTHRIGSYELIDVLGQGGMGIVYRAVQDNPRRPVALKVIRPGIFSLEMLKRFQHEAQILGRLQHPGIAQVYEAATADTGSGVQPFFAMELVQGSPLTSYAQSHGLSVRDRLDLLAKVCDAVQHAHQKGVIHRDLKPGNILVTDDGQPKILDFGVARATDSDIQITTVQTDIGQLLGTVPYMSPEQVGGLSQDLDTRSDVYSLGVIAYELLAGRLPHDLRHKAIPEAARIICDEQPPSMGSTSKVCRGDVETIVSKAMEKEKARRYQSAGELASDIRRFLLDEPIVARPPRFSREVARLVRRHRAAAITSAVALVTIVVAAAITTRSLTIASQRLTENHRLSDSGEILALQREVDRVATDPANIPLFEDWLRRAGAVASRLPIHRQAIDELRTRGRKVSNQNMAEGESWQFAEPVDQQQYDLLVSLVSSLERFTHLDPAIGTVARVRKQLEEAGLLYRRSIDEHRPSWQQVIVAAGDPLDPVYHGLALTPQLGLVPIGRDPDSGLWEFAHVLTGDVPERDKDGRLLRTENMSLVFVLLPGAPAHIGAVKPDSEQVIDEPFVDPYAASYEGPVQTIPLDAFFISKYEMTQGQWLRATGSNPSTCKPPYMDDLPCTLLHPVESIDWFEADTTMARLGLLLPTSAQWEYAARGGTTTPWYTGPNKESLQGAENLADRQYAARRPPWARTDPELDDGYERHAPVGSFRPNPFGLHDVLGNVTEWCRDSEQSYLELARAGDGLRGGNPPDPKSIRAIRGGSFHDPPIVARCSHVAMWHPTDRQDTSGLRPARPVR